MREFAFELRLCDVLEDRREGIVGRQLGGGVAEPGGRILDVVCVDPGPAFADRCSLSSAAIPGAAIESAVGPGRARYWKAAFDCHPDRARRAVDRACEIGFFERERRGGRDYVRQVARYPDWIGHLVGIENKPDLGRPGDLENQLRTDVALGLVDKAVLCTESYVTGAHLNRIPDAVGVWRFDPETAVREVIREPTQLAVDEPGIEPVASQPGRTDIAIVSAAEKARARRRIAERAYGKGWRTYAVPDCKLCEPERAAADTEHTRSETLPYCTWNDRLVDAATECGPSCPGYSPGDVAVDLEAERAARTPWVADPAGPRQQTGLDRFS